MYDWNGAEVLNFRLTAGAETCFVLRVALRKFEKCPVLATVDF